MVLLRAVVMIHPAGLGGRPLDGHRSHRRGKRLLDRLLGEIDVPEGARQHGDRAPVLLAEHLLDVDGRQRHGHVI